MGSKYQRWTDEERRTAREAALAEKRPREVFHLFPGRSQKDVRNMIALARRSIDGRCQCGRPMPEGDYALKTCLRCVAKSKAYLSEARSLGLCTRCFRPADGTLTKCRECARNSREWSARQRPPPSGRPDFAWSGLLRWLSSGRMSSLAGFIPAGAKTVVDLFGGSAAFSISVLPHVERTVYNDVHPGLCDLVRVIQAGQVRELVELSGDLRGVTPDALLDLHRRSHDLPPVCRAATLLTLAQSVENRDMHRKVVRVVRTVGDSYVRRVRRLEPILRPLVVHNLDFAEVIERYDGPDTVFFSDPPYPLTSRYEHNLSVDRFVELTETLRRVRGRFLLTTGCTRFAAACISDLPHTWWWMLNCGPIRHRLLVATNYEADLAPVDLSKFALGKPAHEAVIAKGSKTLADDTKTPRDGTEFPAETLTPTATQPQR